jgi:REP element-mobilizing transposase RayT
MARGLERRAIFSDAPDYHEFVDRLDHSLEEIRPAAALAWVLMPNHFHLLVQAGQQGTPPLMRRLMTGYAGLLQLAPPPQLDTFSRTDTKPSFAKKRPTSWNWSATST